MSLDPADEGHRLVRQYAFQGDALLLSGDWTDHGEPMRFTITWVREKTAAVSDAQRDLQRLTYVEHGGTWLLAGVSDVVVSRDLASLRFRQDGQDLVATRLPDR